MLLSPHPTLKSKYLTPGSNRTIAGGRYHKGLRVEQSKPLPYVRKGYQVKTRQTTRRRRTHALRVGWDGDDREDGRRLASDPTISIPSEEPRRTPRLQRQEAFRAPHDWEDDVDDDAVLYRLGILYDGNDDNSHARGPGFSLDSIVHAEPTYSVRPAKRVKKTHHLPLKEKDLHLSVNLLSTYLTKDVAIAHFLQPMDDEALTWLHTADYVGPHGTNRDSATPLATIQELPESSTHSPAPAPAAINLPDLISNTGEEDREEYGEDGDWALVSDPGADAVSPETGVDVVSDDGEVANSVDGAWVFVAEDDS